MSKLYKLDARYDSRKSFYGKAQVIEDNYSKTLYSYNTPVCEIGKRGAIVFDFYPLSPTTLRHIKEFLLQNGYKAESKAQILKDYQR